MSARDEGARRRKSRFVEGFELGLVVSAGALLRLAPASLARSIGAAGGRFAETLVGGRRRLAARNLELAMPELDEASRREILHGCFRHYGAELADFVRHLDRSAAELGERVDVVGRENFERAMAPGNGVVAFSAHLGSWEAAVAALPKLGASFLVVARPLDNRLLERRLRAARGRGVEVVHRRQAARPIVAALQAGRPIITLPDQAAMPRDGELVPFLGREGWTTTAPARLALRFDAPLVSMFCYPDRNRYRLEIGAPRFPGALSDEERDPIALTRWVNDTISDAIRAHPELWLWMHDRWKRVDEDEDRGSGIGDWGSAGG